MVSHELVNEFNETWTSVGPTWYSLFFSSTSYETRLAINSTVPANIYISKGPWSDPSDLDHDLSIL